MARSARYRETKNVFITSVNVFFMDIIKLCICSIILLINEQNFLRFLIKKKKKLKFYLIKNKLKFLFFFFSFLKSFRNAIFYDLIETIKICIPSLIYNFQNNLYYIALSNLESTTFCVGIFHLIYF